MRLRLNVLNNLTEPWLTAKSIENLTQAISQVARSIRFITLEGTNDVFCEGFDLVLFTREQAQSSDVEALSTAYGELVAAIQHATVPVIAVVNGKAIGGGVGIAAACDLALSSPQASFALPESLFGLIPARVFPVLAQRVGVSRARLLALGAKVLSAVEALRWGLVDEVNPDTEKTIAQYGKRFARMDVCSLRSMKRLIADYLPAAREYETRATAEFLALSRSETTRIRIDRFLAGDTPWSDGNE